MQGYNKAILPPAISNASRSFTAATFSQRRIPIRFSGTNARQRLFTPGLLPRLAIIHGAFLNTPGASSGPVSSAGARSGSEPASNAHSHRASRSARPLYKLSEDPLLRQTQMLLEASRRLREQSVPLPSVEQQTYYGCSSSPAGVAQDPAASQCSGIQRDGLAYWEEGAASASANSPRESRVGATASFGAPSAAAAATAHVTHITAASTTAANAATASATAAASPATAPKPAGAAGPAAGSTGRTVLTAVGTAASVAAVAAALPPAASASGGAGLTMAASTAASVAASVATSGWLAIEELLEEAAYTLSQQIPDGQRRSPLDALLASTSTSTTSSGAGSGTIPDASTLDLGLQQLLQGLQFVDGTELLSPVSLPGLDFGPMGSGGTASGGGGLMAVVVRGEDRLSEMLEDLLYSLSQDINLAAAQEAVLAAATAATAGLAGAAAELPRAAASVYHSAAAAAEAAAMARAAAAAAAARGPSGGGSGGTALVVPDESQRQLVATLDEYDDAGKNEYSMEQGDAGDMSATGNPPWDLYGTIRAAESDLLVPDPSAAAAAPAVTDAAVAAAAAADGPTAVLPPIVTAASASTAVDAATATAVAVVEAATTAAAGTIIINATPSVIAPLSSSDAPAMAAVVDDASAAAAAAPAAAPSAPSVAAAPPPPLPAAADLFPSGIAPKASDGLDSMLADNGLGAAVDTQPLDELTAALQSMLAQTPAALPSTSLGLDADLATAATVAAAAAVGSTPQAEDGSAAAALSSFTEALRRELGAAVAGTADVSDAEPFDLVQSAGLAVTSALSSLPLEQQLDLAALPQDLRLSTLLGATVQSSLDLVESALTGIRTADSTLVGGVTIAAVLAVLIRSLVSMAGMVMDRGPVVGAGDAAADVGNGRGAADAAPCMRRPVGVTALEAAAALNNDPQAILLDIRNGSDVQEQGLPDLRPFRRGSGAIIVPLPYCDLRTTPTLAMPSGSLLGAALAAGAGSSGRKGGTVAADGGQSPSTALALLPGTVTVSVDPLFCLKFKQLDGLSRDSRVFLIDSYGVEASEAVLLLRSDPGVEALLGAEGVKYVEGGFAGPEGWKLTGLPVTDAPSPVPEGAGAPGAGPWGLDLSGLLSRVASLRVRYPSLFSRTLAAGAVGGAGLAAASSLDWTTVSRGTVGLAAAMLLTDRALPPGVRPSGRIRQYLQSQLSDLQLTDSGRNGGGASGSADLAAARRRAALLLRALDLAEAVGDAVVRAGGAAVKATGSAARGAFAARNGEVKTAAPDVPAAAAAATAATGIAAAVDVDVESDLETPPLAGAVAATIVLPHGMDSLQWSEATEHALAQAQHPPTAAPSSTTAAARPSSPQKQTRSASPLRSSYRLGPSVHAGSSNPSLSAAAAAAAAVTSAAAGPAAAASFTTSELMPPRVPSPSLASRLSDALRNAAGAVVRAASASRASDNGAAALPADASRAASPSDCSSRPGTLELMTALATASALSNIDSEMLPGWPAVSFPKASSGQAPPPYPEEDGDKAKEEKGEAWGTKASGADTPHWPTAEQGGLAKEQERLPADGWDQPFRSSLPSTSLLRASDMVMADAADAPGLAVVAESPAGLWRNGRQELETVAPAPPTVPSMGDEGLVARFRGAGDAGYGDGGRNRYASGATSASAPRVATNQRWGIPTDGQPYGSSAAAGTAGGAGHAARVGLGSSSSSSGDNGDGGEGQRRQQQQQHHKLLRTSSPERAVAGGAALRRRRMQIEGLDDDGLASGAYGGEGLLGDDEGKQLGERFGAASLMAAWRALDTDGSGPSPGVSGYRRKQPLRTASPQRAAAAAAAMRQLRAEMGLPRNDSSDGGELVPRDWRRELDAAAAAAASDSGSDSDQELESVGPTSGGGWSRRSSSSRSSRLHTAEASIWRAQLEGGAHPDNSSSIGGGSRGPGSGSIFTDWRARIENSVPAPAGLSHDGAGHVSSALSSTGFRVPQLRTASTGRFKLTAAERAARDAELQGWRAGL